MFLLWELEIVFDQSGGLGNLVEADPKRALAESNKFPMVSILYR